MYVRNGWMKFDPQGFWTAPFERWGYPVWLRLAVGMIEKKEEEPMERVSKFTIKKWDCPSLKIRSVQLKVFSRSQKI